MTGQVVAMDAHTTYSIPKISVRAEVTFRGSPPQQLNLYLSEQAENHAGYERPSEVLAGPEPFIPATRPDGTVVFLNRNSIQTVTLDAAYEFSEESSDPLLQSDLAVEAEIEVILADSSRHRGVVQYVLPGGQRRLQNYLNLTDRFLVLREEDQACLINKSQVVHVTLI